MPDIVVRATAANLTVRAFAVAATESVEEARRIHGTSPVMTAALGRLLCAGAMMGEMMKGDDDILTLRIRSDGPAKAITVTADSHGNVKGFAAVPTADVPDKAPLKLNVGGVIGRGMLSVTMDLGLKEPYSGTCELQTGEIGDDLAYYFTTSEQTPSAVGLGVKVGTDTTVEHAGGFIIQLMPDADEGVISKLEKNLSGCGSVTALMEKGLGPEEILRVLLADTDLEIQESRPVAFKCSCSREKVKDAVASISKSDLREMIDDGKNIEVKCHFCNSAYEFSVDELKKILAQR